MNPDTPQPGKRGRTARTGDAAGGSSSFDANVAGAQASEQATPDSRVAWGSEPGGSESSTTSRLFDQVKDKASFQINAQKVRATAGLGSVAEAVRQTSRQLRDQRQDVVADFVEQAATQLERFSNHLRDRNLEDLVDDAQRLARQQPAIFIGSSFAAGLIAARFIKASNPPRNDWRSGSNDARADYGRGYGRDSSSFVSGGDFLAGQGASPRSTSESVYGGRSGSASGSSYGAPDERPSSNTADRPETGDIQGRGGL